MSQLPELTTELSVEKFIPEGKALARLEDGRVVLLEGAVPGDRIALERFTEAKGWVKAEVFRLVSPSSRRIEARCPVASECGGCDWMMLGAADQRQAKRAVLEEALQRTGKIRFEPAPPWSGRCTDGYRGRIRLQVQRGRVGFYRRASHELIEPEHCAVSTPLVNLALADVRASVRAWPEVLDAFAWLELREASEGTVSLYLERNEQPIGELALQWLAALRERFIVAIGEAEAASMNRWQRFELDANTYLLSPPGTFTQVNWEVNRALVARVTELAISRGVRTFLDVFSGAGNFSLPWLAAGLRGVSVESSRLAVLAAREAARRQGLPEEGFKCGDAASLARELTLQGRRFDLVFLDPPRAGVKTGLPEIAALATEFVGICSCNPVTLARDLRVLLDQGFSLECVEPFDMFPQTHHLETLALLRRT